MIYKFHGAQIETCTGVVELNPEFKVKEEQVGTSLWRYTITQVFGEYKYKQVEYQYRAEGDTEWITITGNIFQSDVQQNYEIKVLDAQQEKKPEITTIKFIQAE